MPMDCCDNLVDLVPMLNPSSTDISLFIPKSYPNGASFRFHGYNGSKCADQIMTDIKNAATRSGTTLKARRRTRGTKFRKTCIQFSCVKHFLSPSRDQDYHENCIQQNGTIIQPKHSAASIKGSSRSAKLKRKPLVTQCNGESIKKNKSTSTMATSLDTKCPFTFHVFLSSVDDLWYLSYTSRSCNSMCHMNHFKVSEELITRTYSDLPDDIKQYIQSSIANHTNGSIIIEMVASIYNINITQNSVDTARSEYTNQLLREYGLDPAHSSCDKLLQFFRANKDISFLCVTHTLESGFVTTRQSKCPHRKEKITNKEINVDAKSISNDDVKCWRDELKVKDGKEILVALAWIHDEEMAKVSLFPEFLSVDVTFGVNKQRRNLLRFCGIDGHKKHFTAFNCFMPSKQFRAFDWVCRVAFPKLIGKETLRFNTLITSDQESPLISGIRSLIGSREQIGHSFPLGCSSHRLDMFHIFVKEWKNEVSSIIYWC